MSDRRRIRALIVDDERLARTAVRLLLERDPEIEVAGECADGAAAIDRIRAGGIDLVFLDVQMPEMSGFGVIRAIGPDHMPVVVFATAHDEYAIEAFEAQALDYLLKPFDDDRFARALQRAKREVRRPREDELARRLAAALACLESAAARAGAGAARIALKTPGRVVFLDPADIDWIEAADYCVRVHAGKAEHLVRASMHAMEKRITSPDFVRIHRSTIVNVRRIREVQPLYHGDFVVVLHDGTTLRMSRSRRRMLEARLGKLA